MLVGSVATDEAEAGIEDPDHYQRVADFDAIARYSEHWITNTARGAKVSRANVQGELGELAVDAELIEPMMNFTCSLWTSRIAASTPPLPVYLSSAEMIPTLGFTRITKPNELEVKEPW